MYRPTSETEVTSTYAISTRPSVPTTFLAITRVFINLAPKLQLYSGSCCVAVEALTHGFLFCVFLANLCPRFLRLVTLTFGFLYFLHFLKLFIEGVLSTT